jgi:putative redox protein
VSTVRHVARAVGRTGAAAPAYRVDIEAGGHRLVADEPVVAGGGDAGPPPFGLLLAALTACTATTLRMYAERKGWDVATIEVEARYDVADGHATITRTIAIPRAVPAEQRERLAEIAERTPVTLAVRAGTPISTTFRAAP